MGKLSEDQRQEMFAAYGRGESIAGLARNYGIAEQTIWKSLKRRGLLKPRLVISEPLTIEQIEEAAALYESGLSIEAVAMRLERAPATVHRVLADAGMTRTRAEGKLRRVAQTTRDKIEELYRAGKTLDEVVAALSVDGVTRGIAHNELKRRGVKLRPTGQRGKFHDDPGTRRDIVMRYMRGESLSWLSTFYECSRDPIMKVLTEHNIPIRSFDEAVGIQWTDRKGRLHYMKSTWEIKTAEWLDAQLIDWDYEKETFEVGSWKGHTVHYTPDFWIYRPDGSLEKLIDVKGWARPRSMWRIKKFRRKCSEPLEVWDERTLLEHGIIEPKKTWRLRKG